MKLSEAIRAGSTISLPDTRMIVRRSSQNELYACALGAAHLGVGGDPDMPQAEIYEAIEKVWPELNSVNIPVPDDNGYKRPLEEAIWICNDALRWPREKIADWLEHLGY